MTEIEGRRRTRGTHARKSPAQPKSREGSQATMVRPEDDDLGAVELRQEGDCHGVVVVGAAHVASVADAGSCPRSAIRPHGESLF